MTRSLSLTFREAINAQQTGEVAIYLLTITHPDAAGPLRLSSDPTERVSDVPLSYKTVSRSNDYVFVPMAIQWPDETDMAAPRAAIRIAGANRVATELVREFNTPAKMIIETVLASAPDTVEFATPELDIISARLTSGDIILDVALNSMEQEPYPAHNFHPSSNPGLFGLRQG